MTDVTRILERVRQGESRAADELLPLVYEELRRLAAHKMALGPPGQTLQPTALFHEAWLKLAGGSRRQCRARLAALASALSYTFSLSRENILAASWSSPQIDEVCDEVCDEVQSEKCPNCIAGCKPTFRSQNENCCAKA